MSDFAYQVSGFAYQGSGLFAYQGTAGSPLPITTEWGNRRRKQYQDDDDDIAEIVQIALKAIGEIP